MKPTSSTRNARTRRAGGKVRSIRRPLRYSTLTARQKAVRERALNLLSDLRRGEDSYSGLLRKHRLNTQTAHRYLGRNLLGGVRGQRVRASKADRFVRELLFPQSSGDVRIRTRSSRDATKLSDYYNDRDKLLRGKLGVADFEAKRRGVRIEGQELFADAGAILGMAEADVLQMENLYASLGPER